MATLPEQYQDSPTIKAIYAAYEAKRSTRMSRRLGASIIGKACDRAIWFDFRWAGVEQFEGRMLRLFNTGHLTESRFVADLRAIGCTVYDVDPETNCQVEYTAIDGHVIDKLDAIILGIPEAPKTWHAGEFKTHSSKSFSELKREGLLKSKPQHHAQLMLGMHLAELTRGLYLAVNKDTDELYAERIEHDVKFSELLLAKATKIIDATSAPNRISTKRDSLDCRFCCHNNRCHGSHPPDAAVPAMVTCRSCVHSTPVTDSGTKLGIWRCEKHGKTLSEVDQRKACPDHLFLPDFITFAEPQDSGNDADGDWIEYRNADGAKWKNTKGSNGYKSTELTVLPTPMIGCGIVEVAKAELGAEAVEVSL